MPPLRHLAAAAALTLAATVSASAQNAAHTVEITAFRFVPETLRARPGDTVLFVNKDVVPHTASQVGAGGWDSGRLEKDRSWTLKVEAAGPVDYFCRFHPSMKGKLVVE
jgi:plastocyanin